LEGKLCRSGKLMLPNGVRQRYEYQPIKIDGTWVVLPDDMVGKLPEKHFLPEI
jgi:hypothetical protein